MPKGSHLKKKQSKYGHSPEGGGGFNPFPNVLEHFFLGALYLGNMQKGGGKVIAKRFGALLKIFYSWIPFKEFLIWAKCPRGGGFGRAKRFGALF